MSDFVLILSLLYYWPFGGEIFFPGVVGVKKQKTIVSSWFHRKLNFLEKSFYFKHGYLLLFLHNSHGTKEIPDCGNLVRPD